MSKEAYVIDTTEIGIVAAKVMQDLEEMQHSGELDDDAQVVSALVTYEVRSGSDSTVGGRCTDDRNVLGLGLLVRMKAAMLDPDD